MAKKASVAAVRVNGPQAGALYNISVYSASKISGGNLCSRNGRWRRRRRAVVGRFLRYISSAVFLLDEQLACIKKAA